MKKLLLTSCLALGITSGLFAVTVMPDIGGAATGAMLHNLDSDGNPMHDGVGQQAFVAGAITSVSYTGTAQFVTGSVDNVYAAPYISGSNGTGFGNANGPDDTRYLSTGIGSVTINFSSDQNYFGLLWGSVDTYNTLTFWLNGAPTVVVTGTDVNPVANGDQGMNNTFYVNITDLWYDKVVLSSTQYAFEIDNIAYGALNVPDAGATAALLALSLGCLFFFRRKAA